jgi:hypothetical protein
MLANVNYWPRYHASGNQRQRAPIDHDPDPHLLDHQASRCHAIWDLDNGLIDLSS